MAVKRIRKTASGSVVQSTNVVTSTRLEQFKQDFPQFSSIADDAQLERLININSGVREWYISYKADEATKLEMPKWLEKTPSNIDDWEKVKAARETQKVKEKSWNERIKQASKTLRETVTAVEKERATLFRTLSDLDIIDRVSIEQLPDDLALEYATTLGDRETLDQKAKDLVLQYKTRLYQDKKNGTFKSPFSAPQSDE